MYVKVVLFGRTYISFRTLPLDTRFFKKRPLVFSAVELIIRTAEAELPIRDHRVARVVIERTRGAVLTRIGKRAN